jgi:hypothetical protein
MEPQGTDQLHSGEARRCFRTKRCWKCSLEKSILEFGRCRSRGDGLQPECNPCRKLRGKKDSKHNVARVQKWQEEHKSERKRYMREYVRRRLMFDPVFRMIANCRTRTRSVFIGKRVAKTESSLALLGCTPVRLQEWLVGQFKLGMTVENYGKVWDVDHIVPCSAWDMSNPIHVKCCFYYENPQPMFKADNVKKGGTNLYPIGHFDLMVEGFIEKLKSQGVL